jgi:hypothetical protein
MSSEADRIRARRRPASPGSRSPATPGAAELRPAAAAHTAGNGDRRPDELLAADMRNARRAIEYYFEQNWTDGLPVVPPIAEFVDEFLATTGRDPEEVVLRQDHLFRTCSVRLAAINAVMAGCKPEYFPALLGVLDAFEAGGGGGGLAQSTTGQGQIVIINGPVRDAIGINCRENILGPGDRANSTIGRALRLIILNVLGVRPHEFDQSTQGTPIKYACVIGENEEESPWEPLHVERGYRPEQSAATVQMVRSDLHVEHRSTQSAEEILNTIADSMSYSGAIYEAPPYNRNNGSVIVMGPEHAGIIAAGGFKKQEVKQYLWERFGKTKAQLRSYGKIIGLEEFSEEDFIHSTPTVDNLLLVVSGASNAGVSTVFSGFVHRYSTAAIAHTAP